MLMVGDSIVSDGHGAKNFGIDFCFINNHSLDILPSEPLSNTILTLLRIYPFVWVIKPNMGFLEAYKSMTTIHEA